MIYDWPRNMVPQVPAFNPRGMVVGGPPSLTGRTMVGSVDAGYWTAALRSVVITKKDQIKAFRALRALLEGGAHHIRVPAFDCYIAPWPVGVDGKAVAKVGPVSFSDGAGFSDASTFYQPSIAAVVVGDTALRSTRITVDFLNAGCIEGGEYFSIGDRLYTIKAVIAENDTERTLAIWPPLREAVAGGAAVEFDRPVCRMRLADEAAMDIALEFGRRAFPDLAFVEVS